MRKLMWFAVGFVCACLLAVYALPEGWLPWAALTGIGVCVIGTLLLRRRERTSNACPYIRITRFLILGLTVGLLWCLGYVQLALSPARELAGKDRALTVEVSGWPVKTDYGLRVDVLSEADGRRVPTRLYLYGKTPELEPGDRLTGRFTLRSSDRAAAGLETLSLRAKGILLTGSGKVETVEPGGAPLRYFPARLSRRIFDRLGALLPADAAGLPQAMLCGDRSGLSAAVQEALSASGASHIVAVSGLHVAMLFGVLLLLLGNRGWQTALPGGLLLLLYVLMTGASPSVVRAALMLGLLLLGPLLGRENDPPTALALAALLCLLANPWAVSNLSFQLSFAAVAGLLLVSRRLERALLALPALENLLRWKAPSLPRRPRYLLVRTLRGFVRFVCGSLAATCGALLFTTPIAAAAFGSVPVYGLLTNLFVLPLATLCLTGALAVLALGLISSALGGLAGWLLTWPVRAIYGICKAVASLPGSRLSMDLFGVAFLLFAGGLLLFALLRRESNWLRPLGAVLAALVLAVCVQGLDAASARFSVAALDVGQGQCVCMVSSGFAAVVDCGGSDGSAAGAEAAGWLRQHGASQVDALILTHYDADHVNGAAALLETMPVAALYLPDVDFNPESRAALERTALETGAELRYVRADETLSFPGGSLRLFAPVSGRSDNAACVSVLYSAGEYDMLITGDLDAGGEYALLEQLSLPQVELYVAGHHGSARSSSEALLEAIRPETVFVSVGRNAYNLPSEEALDRIRAVGATVYRTDECGNLEISVH